MTTPHNEYPKRLIEVDLPIARISAHARREKSIRHGHISTLHIWWARRPLAACRAVLCASLWPDPVELTAWAERGEEVPVGDGSVVIRPRRFLDTARERMTVWANRHLGKVSKESYPRFVAVQNGTKTLADPVELRRALLDFIADFANWDHSTDKDYLETARALTQAAHEALGGEPDTRPLVVDPFAGGGSIPLEALRVGADAFASDLNPIPVLLNKVVLEYIPTYGQRLADEVRKWGAWIKQEAEKELAEFYPKDPDGATPIAYLWARTIRCEGPGCGAEVPLIRSLWLVKKANRSIGLQLIPNLKEKRVDFQIIIKQREDWVDQANPQLKIEKPKFEGTVKRGSVTCPCCGYTTKIDRVRAQLYENHGGSNNSRLLAVVMTSVHAQGRSYYLPSQEKKRLIHKTIDELLLASESVADYIPNEPTIQYHTFVNRGPIYGMQSWRDYYTSRQLLSLSTFARLIDTLPWIDDEKLGIAVKTCLALALDKLADLGNSLTRWKPDAECPVNLFGRQAIPFVWDFAEAVPISESSGSFASMYERTAYSIETCGYNYGIGSVASASAISHPLPDNSIHAFITDPPYYYSVQYADLSDFFYVWLKRSIGKIHLDILN